MPRQKRKLCKKNKPKAPVKLIPKKPVISSSMKLKLTDACLAFGDVEDVFEDKVIDSDGGTINYSINVRRKFMPGNYMMHIVDTNKPGETDDEQSYANVAILCREDVDPLKIHDLLKSSNFGYDHRPKNFVSRYDWKHFRNWGPFECEEESDSDGSESSSDASKNRKYSKLENNSDSDSSDSSFDFAGNAGNYQDIGEFFQSLLWDEDYYYASGIADDCEHELFDFFWTQVKGRGNTPSPEPIKEKSPEPVKTAEEIAKKKAISQFKNALLDYFKKDVEIVKHCTLFINSDRISEISNGDITIEKDDDDLVYSIKGTKDNSVLGFLLKVATDDEKKALIGGDWHYGCVIQDETSGQGFAFVFGDSYIDNMDDGYCDNFDVNVEETDYTFKIRDFLRTEGPLPGADVYSYDGPVTDRSEKYARGILHKYVNKASTTNVIVLDERWKHRIFNEVRKDERWGFIDEDDVKGPTCHLCDQVIRSDVHSFIFNDVRYIVCFKNVYTTCFLNDKLVNPIGELQCCYCLNYFHRRKCSLSMSNESYLSFKVNRNFACPGCVPAVPFNFTFGNALKS